MPQLANYLHLPVQSGSDRILAAMKRGYTALEFKQKIRKLRAVRPDISHLLGLHRRLPRRDRGRLRQDHEADRGRRLRPVASPSSTRAARARRRRTWRTTRRTRSSTSAWRACRPPSTPIRTRISQAMVGSVQTRAGGRPSTQRPERTDRQHREHALREFPRPCAADRAVRRCGDHRGDGQLAARASRCKVAADPAERA